MSRLRKISFLALLFSCGLEDEPYERLTKFRALGVQFDAPTKMDGGERLQMVFEMAFPAVRSMADIRTSSFEPEGERKLYPTTGATEEATYGSIKIARIKAFIDIPTLTPAESLKLNAEGVLDFSYAVKINLLSEEEIITGQIPLRLGGAPSVVPSFKVNSPSEGKVYAGKEVVLAAEVESAAEPYKVAWFTTSGKILARRALNTKAQNLAPGQQTLIFTVRGMYTGFYMSKVIPISTL